MNEFLGIITVILGIIGYVPYIRSIHKRQTTPHVFTWFIWALLTTIAFIAQIIEGAGAGSWVTGISALGCLYIFFMALKKGEHDITKSDIITFSTALLAIPLWYFTGNALYAVVLVTFIDILGFYPTLRKSYNKPYEENLSLYALSALKFFIALFAMQAFTVVTALYPAALVVINTLFVVMLYWRRKVLVRTK